MEHTPIPWAWVKMPTYIKWDIQTGGDKLILSFFGPVLEACGGEGALGDWGALSISEANAQFIIRAVNNHAALLEALEALEALIHPETRGDIWARASDSPEAIQARAAILAAKGD